MLKWIEKALGRASGNGPSEGDEAWLAQLKTWLSGMDSLPSQEVRHGFAADMLRYVREGEPVSVLGEAGSQEKIGKFLKIIGHHHARNGIDDARRIYSQLDAAPITMLLRLGRVLEASAGTQRRQFRLGLPDGSHWAEALLVNSSGSSIDSWSSERPRATGWHAALLESLLVEAGQPGHALLQSAFTTAVDSYYGLRQRALMVTDVADYGAWVARHADAVRHWLFPAAVPQRLHVIEMLKPLSAAELAPFANELATMVTSSSKQVRAAAEPLVLCVSTEAASPLRRLAVEGDPETRQYALRMVWQMGEQQGDDALRAFARDTAQADKAMSVQALVREWELVKQAVSDSAKVRYEYEVPQIDWSGTLTPEVLAQLDRMWSELNTSVERMNVKMRESHAAAVAAGHNYKLHQDVPYSPDLLRQLKDYVGGADPRISAPRQENVAYRHVMPAINRLAGWAYATPQLMFKVLAFFGMLVDRQGALSGMAASVFNALDRAERGVTLIELSVMLEQAGYSAGLPFKAYCNAWSQLAAQWDNEKVWPYMASQLPLLIESLGQAKDYSTSRAAIFRAVGSLPAPPPILINALFDLALGVTRSERMAAQEALANHPGKEARIIAALADGKSEIRAVAAQWLGRLSHEPAIPALEEAVAREKHDVPKGAMLDALQAMGRPVERYLDRAKLAAEAKKQSTKALPKDIEWFPFDAMPLVRWSDTGDTVPVDVLRWLVIQAVKQKSSEPNAVLRKYCAMFEPGDRERLGQFVLDNWLREDVRPIPADEAMRRATVHATNVSSWMQRSPQYYQNDPMFGKSVEELVAHYLPGCLRQPQGSATGSKGVLAIAAACAGAGAAEPVARYLKAYYGSRASQGKALIGMLAWIEHPTATQLMLSIGNRFRTKSFQEEATRQAQALAERKNWTMPELADRTIPTAGFDETGTMELSYGERTFIARLVADFKVDLFNPDGKKITSLPAPRQDDDADRAKESKKAFSGAKKEIKSIVDLQTDRLYEALCTERDWSFEDWNEYLNRHPIVRRLMQRLVWAQVEDGKVVATFRPLDDGTLTDSQDNEVNLPAEARVRLAHDSILDQALVEQWQQHLADYEVVPLFQQIGKGIYRPSAEQLTRNEIKDFEGYMLESFALRGRATKLGYTRGAAEDGGWFYTYEKRFPTLGMTAVIDFTGGPLPEENRKIALVRLTFVPNGQNHWQRNELVLSRVPLVLLSECYNDMRLLAADGTGFDPDWQKKSQY
ncbi:DUF4132 domain-containing protein [Dyella sp.]|uniref:DUF4132 domain-containing protein n=1 Tax=Dyella sp. TaxID=1869338 RepID=UPI002ED2D44E